MGSLRVMVVSDDPSVREELAARLAEHAADIVVEQSEAGFVAAAAPVPQVIVWDLSWYSGGSGVPMDFDAALAPVVALVVDEAGAAAALSAGARGCLVRDVDTPRLVTALHAAARGLTVVDPTLTLPWHPDPQGTDLPSEDLTARETEVLQLLAEGLPNRRIAQRLGISEHTVNSHVDAIFGKLGVHRRTEAVARAARAGLIVL